MDILCYSNLDTARVKKQFDRTVAMLASGDFRAADAKKLTGTPYYRAKLNETDRLIFRFASYQEKTCLLLLEIIANHAYEKSRFLRGHAAIDESKLQPLPDLANLPDADRAVLPYVNPKHQHFHVLDKIISFDDAQHEALLLHPPLILIGSAGSGKTVLTLEKINGVPLTVSDQFFWWCEK